MSAAVVALVLAPLVGCSWVFQEHLSGDYDGSHEPRCSTSSALEILDVGFGTLNGIAAIGELSNSVRTQQDDLFLTSSIIWTVVHMASAVTASHWKDECQRAQIAWDSDDAPRPAARSEESVEAAELRRERAARTHPARVSDDAAAAEPAPRPRAPAHPVAARPRGFFCTSSPSAPKAGTCAREKAACEQVRGVAAAAVADLAPCQLVETAFCFDAGSGDAEERCAPSMDACTTQRERAGTAPVDTGCAELR